MFGPPFSKARHGPVNGLHLIFGLRVCHQAYHDGKMIRNCFFKDLEVGSLREADISIVNDTGVMTFKAATSCLAFFKAMVMTVLLRVCWTLTNLVEAIALPSWN